VAAVNIALLIDCENAKPESIEGILSELAEKGVTNVRRAYGNWKNQAGWEAQLHPFSIQPVQQFAYTKGKNAVDMCMAIDVLRAVIDSMKGEGGAAPMAQIGQYISNHSSLSPKNYGYARWSDLIRATGYFDEVPGENQQPRFKAKARAKSAEPS
jgi:hypothetical protein